MNLIVTNNTGEYVESCVSLDHRQGIIAKKKKKRLGIKLHGLTKFWKSNHLYAWGHTKSKIYSLPSRSGSTENEMKLNFLGGKRKSSENNFFPQFSWS